MNLLQQEIHRVSEGLTRLKILKSESKKVSISALESIDTRTKAFQKLFREIKKLMTEENDPIQMINKEVVSERRGFVLDKSGIFLDFGQKGVK